MLLFLSFSCSACRRIQEKKHKSSAFIHKGHVAPPGGAGLNSRVPIYSENKISSSHVGEGWYKHPSRLKPRRRSWVLPLPSCWRQLWPCRRAVWGRRRWSGRPQSPTGSSSSSVIFWRSDRENRPRQAASEERETTVSDLSLSSGQTQE